MMQSITNDVHHVAGGATLTYQSARSTNCVNVSGATCTSASVTLTVGDLMVGSCWSWDSTGTRTMTFSDTQSNTWNQIDTSFFQGGNGLFRDYWAIISTGGSATFTCTGTGATIAPDFTDMHVDTWTSSTGWPASPVDQHAINSFLGTAPCSNTTPLNTTQAIELLYGACTGSGTAGPTVSAPLIQAQLTTGNSTISAYRSLSSTGSYTFSVTDSNANPEASVLVTFKPN